MDSKAINKLIRSEIWPLLRQQGFTQFDSRTARRYRDPFIDVVGFQSFNAYSADRIGCTTFSFRVELGVFLPGGVEDRWLKFSPDGRLLPISPACAHREILRKRSPIDGFDSMDIFYIDPEGHTTAAAFNELRSLIRDWAPNWFAAFEDPAVVVARVESGSCPQLGTGSFYGNSFVARLSLREYTKAPGPETERRALDRIESTLSALLDNYPAILFYPERIEQEAGHMFGLLSQLGASPPWPLPAAQFSEPETMDCRGFRPLLKPAGFKQFTTRHARRTTDSAMQLIEVVPVDRDEQKRAHLPAGLFRLAACVHWPVLARHERIGTHPEYNDSHLVYWLPSPRPADPARPTLFTDAGSALEAVENSALPFFAVCDDAASLSQLLSRTDREIFLQYPTLRGCGGAQSVFRHLLMAFLARQLDDPAEAARRAHQACEAIALNHPNRQPGLRESVTQILERLHLPGPV
jgi:hypothetical protein